MASLPELFQQLGIDPTRRQGPASVGEYAAVSPLALENILKGLGPTSGSAPGSAMPGMPGLPAATVVPYYSGTGKSVGGGDSGGFWGALGGIFHTAMRVIDTPRAVVVSTIKETRDALHHQDGGWSWSDWASQGVGPNHIGFGEVVQDAFPNASPWVKDTLGFVGDVGLDPLTWTGSGAVTKGGAKGLEAASASEKALVAAVKSGERKAISEALLVRATELGVQDSPEVQKLVAKAARQGRGAFTERSLATIESGLRESLNLPTLSRTIFGKHIPGSQLVADADAAAKGAIKETLGRTPAAKYYRHLRVGEQNGKRALLNIIRSSDDPEKVSAAVGLLHYSQSAAREADMRVDFWTRSLRKELKGAKEIAKLDKDFARQLTDDIERGIMSQDTEPFRRMWDSIKSDLEAVGVDFGWQPNYVPRVSTYEARIAARTDAGIKKWIRDLNTTSFFESERTLVAGADFLGHTVPADATIRWFNEVSMAEKGIKFFEDDVRDIMSIYMGQARNSLYRGRVTQLLEESGFAKARPFTREMTDTEREAFAAVKADLKAARKDQSLILSSGAKVRRDQIETFSHAVGVRRGEVQNEMKVLRGQAAELGRRHSDLTAEVAVREADLAAARAELDLWEPVARKERGVARDKARKAVARAEKRVADAEKAVGSAKGELDAFIRDGHQVGGRPGGRLAAAAQSLQDQVAGLQGKAQELASEYERLTLDHQELLLHVNQLGDIPFASMGGAERTFAVFNDDVNWVTKKLASAETDLADVGVQLVSTENIIAGMEPLVQNVDAVYAKARAARKLTPNQKNYVALLDETRSLMRMFEPREMKLVMKNGDDAAEIIYRQQAVALSHDLQAIKNGTKIRSLEDSLAVMGSKDFGSKLIYNLDNGWAALGDTLQIPGWADDAMLAKGMLKDPEFFPNAVKYMRQFENLWKGWATARPGFIVRNAISSMFNVYLEAGIGSAASVERFREFFSMYRKDPTGYMEEAALRWGDNAANQLNDALSVIPATGGGLSASEFHTDMLHRPSLNPLKPEFAPIYGTRHLNENLEAIIRGGHAYDVLKRGGSTEMATDIVNKWHFNYRDITEFDRAMKHVIPFWVFFSNNVALQAHVWTGKLSKLNRTYFNAMRNLESGQPNEVGMPEWQKRQMGLPLDINPDGTSRYLNLGLPSIQFATDVTNALDRPSSLLSNLGPLVGLPLEGAAGKNFYTGNSLGGYRNAGIYGALGLGETTGSGGKALTPYQLDILNGLLPGVATTNRITGGTGDAATSIGSFFGFSTSKLTPEQRLAEERKRKRKESAAEYKKKVLEGM